MIGRAPRRPSGLHGSRRPRTGGRVPGTLTALLTAAVLAACGTTEASQETADLVLRGGKVVTVDDALGEAQAVAVRGDRILAVGSDEEIDAYIGDATEVVELEGRLVTPGFIEGHGHYLGLGDSKMILDLTMATTWDEIVAMVEEATRETPPGTWIRGRGWHQEKWTTVPQPAVEGVPVHASLSAVSPDHPVILTHASGHAAFANGRALEMAGITGGTADPAGGTIVKDASGQPTGLLRETAQRLVSAAMAEADASVTPGDRDARFRRQVQLAGEEALAHGVTSFHDAGADFETIDRLKAMADGGELPVRLYVMVRRASNEEMAEKLPEYFMDGYANGFLTVRSIKRQIDGALGSHGAWLLEPYEDLPSTAGLVLETVEDIERTAEIAIEHGFQVNTHGIGDRGNREILDIYERVFAANPDKSDLRWRIEHAQHLHPDDIPRFAELGVIAAVQGVHCTSDGPWVPDRIGHDRAESGAYVWRDLIESGAIVANGTDVPVERIDPLASYYASVSRMMNTGDKFYPEQVMTRMEALESYTINNAIASFQEDVVGSITPGKYADLTVLSKDILTIPEAEIPGTQVDLTILGGEVRYRRAQLAMAAR